jgi:23S rRNA pseudouridine2604 synthase
MSHAACFNNSTILISTTELNDRGIKVKGQRRTGYEFRKSCVRERVPRRASLQLPAKLNLSTRVPSLIFLSVHTTARYRYTNVPVWYLFKQQPATNERKYTMTAAAAAEQLVRLNKLIVSKIGGCSRREADKYIAAGWVRVNGVTVDSVGTKVCPTTAKIQLDDAARNYMRTHSTTVILHKPLGVVSSQPDRPEQVPAVKLLTADNMFVGGYYSPKQKRTGEQHLTLPKIEPYRLNKIAVAGRLDVNTSGLLLFTQCGKTASQIVGPTSTVEKEYLVRLNPALNGARALADDASGELEERIERLRSGIECSGELLEAVAVDVVNEDQLQVILQAGKKHHIRRMMEAMGWGVQALKRVRIGNIHLGHLPRGQWRYVNPTEKVL